MLLTDTQKANLLKRSGLDVAIRKNNEFAIRKHLEKFLESITDVNFILCFLPKKQIKRHLKDKHVYALLQLVGQALEILEYASIDGDIGKPDEWRITTSTTNEKTQEKTFDTRAANDQDMFRSVQLNIYLERLNKFTSDKDPARKAYFLNCMEARWPQSSREYISMDDRKGMERVAQAVHPAEPIIPEEPKNIQGCVSIKRGDSA